MPPVGSLGGKKGSIIIRTSSRE